MSKRKTRHFLAGRDIWGKVLLINTETKQYIWADSSLHESLAYIDSMHIHADDWTIDYVKTQCTRICL